MTSSARHLAPSIPWALVALALWASPAPAQTPDAEALKARFVGHYELVSYQTFPRAGEAVDMEYVGRIHYDAHGNMSAIGMPRDLPDRARASDENVRAGFAYWGTYSFDPANRVVVHHVEGSPTRGSWPGTDNVRYYELTGDGLLKLSLRDTDGRTTATLTWRKLGG